MKKTVQTKFFIPALISSLLMLFFTFFTAAWYSDQGFTFGFEIPVSTERGLLMLLSDSLWMAAPFLLICSLFLALFGEKGKKIALVLAPLPLTLYALMRTLAYFNGQKSHLTLFVTLFALTMLSAFTVTGAFETSVRPIAAKLSFTYMGIETLLLILSFLFQEKYSFFYFSQLLPMGHFSHFRYSFFSISIFLYYMFYALTLALLLFMKEQEPTEETGENTPEEKAEEQLPREEEEEEIPLSLEDLGISR